MQKLSIIVPVLNEEKTIKQVLERLLTLDLGDWQKEIIVVNDGSTDRTGEIVKPYQQQVVFLSHEKNQGKGAAIRTALSRASGDAIIIQDGDLEYDPSEFALLLAEFNAAHPAVFGSRNLKPKRRGYFYYVLGVKVLTTLVNLLFGAKLTDSYTCYKLIDINLARSLNLKSRGFEFEAEVTAKILKIGREILEVPISYYPRSFQEGKKIRALDALCGAWAMLRIKFAKK